MKNQVSVGVVGNGGEGKGEIEGKEGKARGLCTVLYSTVARIDSYARTLCHCARQVLHQAGVT